MGTFSEIAGLRDSNQELHAEACQLREQVAKLSNELELVDAARMKAVVRCAIAEERAANLTSLYVASCRLHSSVDREELLSIIIELVANLIGSEETAIFDLRGDRLVLAKSLGVDAAKLACIAASEGIIGRSVARRRIFVASRDGREGAAPNEESLTACVPLEVGGQIIGAVAVYRMLAHKNGLLPPDYDLLEMLGRSAAVALYTAELHARAVGDTKVAG